MKTLKIGDVVVIEWKNISPNILSMAEYDGCIGVIEYHKDNDDKGIRVQVEELYLDKYHSLWFHPSSLTKIGTL